MLKREFEEITKTEVFPDVYTNIIEPMYMNGPVWLGKKLFCKLIDKKFVRDLAAVPGLLYHNKINDKLMRCQMITTDGVMMDYLDGEHEIYSLAALKALRKSGDVEEV